MSNVLLWGWDESSGEPRKLICNAEGKLIIDPSEILEDDPTDGEMGKAPTSNWAHDHCNDPDAHTALNSLRVRTGLAVGIVFSGLSQASREWQGMCAAPNGDIYASVYNGDIYIRQGGTGDFIGLGQTARNWVGMCAAPNGDIYATVYNGDIYIRQGGTGNFAPLSQTSRKWRGICAAPNGDIYACVATGDIYIRQGGTGNFVALGQTSRDWGYMAASSEGDIYANVFNLGIYIRQGGTGDFVTLYRSARQWRGIAVDGNNDVYVSVYNGDIYIWSNLFTPDSLIHCTGDIHGASLRADNGASGTVVCGGKSLTSSYGIVSAISNAYSTLTTGTYTDTSVSGKGLLILDTSGGDITIKGLSGGTARQMIWCIKTSYSNAVNLIYESGDASAEDRIWTCMANNDLIYSGYIGGFVLYYTGSRWIVDRVLST